MKKSLKGLLECKIVPPYYSENQDVYHMCGNCTEGNNIEPENRRSGTGGALSADILDKIAYLDNRKYRPSNQPS